MGEVTVILELRINLSATVLGYIYLGKSPHMELVSQMQVIYSYEIV